MLDEEIFRSIECAVPHTRANKSDYRFIVKEPFILQCRHHVCKECKGTTPSLPCKICNSELTYTEIIGEAADKLVQKSLKELTGLLNDGYSHSIESFAGKKGSSRQKIDNLRLFI